MNYDKKFRAFCKKIDFDDNLSQNLYKLVQLHDGKINSVIVRSHFPFAWAVCVRIVEGMVKNKLAEQDDNLKIDGGIKLLPPKDRLGWLASEESDDKKDEKLRRIIEGESGIICDWKITYQDEDIKKTVEQQS